MAQLEQVYHDHLEPQAPPFCDGVVAHGDGQEEQHGQAGQQGQRAGMY